MNETNNFFLCIGKQTNSPAYRFTNTYVSSSAYKKLWRTFARLLSPVC